jgi:hypothetical protein
MRRAGSLSLLVLVAMLLGVASCAQVPLVASQAIAKEGIAGHTIADRDRGALLGPVKSVSTERDEPSGARRMVSVEHFGADGHLVVRELYDESGAPGAREMPSVSSSGQELELAGLGPDGRERYRLRLVLDEEGKRIAEYRSEVGAGSVAEQVTYFGYDEKGRCMVRVDASGQRTTFGYGTSGQLAPESITERGTTLKLAHESDAHGNWTKEVATRADTGAVQYTFVRTIDYFGADETR